MTNTQRHKSKRRAGSAGLIVWLTSVAAGVLLVGVGRTLGEPGALAQADPTEHADP